MEILMSKLFLMDLSQNIANESKGGFSATGQDLDGRNKTSLRKEWTTLYNFVKGGNDSLSQDLRRETDVYSIFSEGCIQKRQNLFVW